MLKWMLGIICGHQVLKWQIVLCQNNLLAHLLKFLLHQLYLFYMVLIESFHWVQTSVYFCYMADVLVSNNVQWSFTVAMGQCRQLTVQVLHIITHIKASSIICKPWMGGFVRCSIATAKVLFPHWPLYVVGHQYVRCVTDVRIQWKLSIVLQVIIV